MKHRISEHSGPHGSFRSRVGWLLLAGVIATGCAVNRPEPRVVPRPAGFVPPERFSVRVDPRVELFSILFRLAGVREYTKACQTPYSRAVDLHFKHHRRHPAVQATRDLHASYSIGYNAPMDLSVHLASFESLHLVVPLDPYPHRLDGRWRQAPVADYLEKVRDFVKKTDFAGFMARRAEYFRAVEAGYAQALEGVDLLGWFDEFFGPRPSVSCVLIPGLLNGPNGYGTSVVLSDGTELISPVLGLHPCDQEGQPVIRDEASLTSYLQHEMAHAYINPAVNTNSELLEPVAKRVYRHVAEEMEEQAYGSWLTVMYESGVRASTILFLRDRYGPAVAAKALARDESRSFLWLSGLVDLFDRYRKGRDGYPSFAKFVPEWVSVLDTWEKLPPEDKVLPFRGPINAAFRRRANTLLVAPNVLEGQAASRSAAAYVRSMHASLFSKKGVPLLDASRVTSREMSSRALILYGTPGTNPILAKMLERFGWQVTPDAIRIDAREFSGQDLVLIACHPHPRNPRLPVVVYAVGRNQDLVGINDLLHGRSDWIVARRDAAGTFSEVASGDFPRDAQGQWLPLPADDPM